MTTDCNLEVSLTDQTFNGHFWACFVQTKTWIKKRIPTSYEDWLGLRERLMRRGSFGMIFLSKAFIATLEMAAISYINWTHWIPLILHQRSSLLVLSNYHYVSTSFLTLLKLLVDCLYIRLTLFWNTHFTEVSVLSKHHI